MKREEILKHIRGLANSQGFYGRLYRYIMDLDPEDYESYMKHLEDQNFKDLLEMVDYLESEAGLI